MGPFAGKPIFFGQLHLFVLFFHVFSLVRPGLSSREKGEEDLKKGIKKQRRQGTCLLLRGYGNLRYIKYAISSFAVRFPDIFRYGISVMNLLCPSVN